MAAGYQPDELVKIKEEQSAEGDDGWISDNSKINYVPRGQFAKNRRYVMPPLPSKKASKSKRTMKMYRAMMEMNFMHRPMLEEVTPESVNNFLIEYWAYCESLENMMGIEVPNLSLCITPAAKQTILHEGLSPRNRDEALDYLQKIQEDYQEMAKLQLVHSIKKKVRWVIEGSVPTLEGI